MKIQPRNLLTGLANHSVTFLCQSTVAYFSLYLDALSSEALSVHDA